MRKRRPITPAGCGSALHSWLAFGIVIVTGGIASVVYALRREESPASRGAPQDQPRPA